MFLYADLLKARLIEDITDVQATITIDDASRLPTLDVDQYLLVEVQQDNRIEVMQCTDITGDVLTVTRSTYYPHEFTIGALCTISIDPYGYELDTGGGSSGLSQQQVLARVSIGF